jgi:fatty-acyl-CoA synthase
MLGLMQHHPLLISSLLAHAASAHQSAQIVSLMPGGEAHRCGYVEIAPPC